MAFGGNLKTGRLRRLLSRGRLPDDNGQANGADVLPDEMGPPNENGQEAERRAALEHAQEQVRLRMPEVYVYPLVVQNARDVITLFDRKGRVFYTSPSWEEILGYAHDEVTGLHGLELVHPDDHVELGGIIQNLDGGETALSQVRVRHKQGNWVPLELSAAHVRDNTGADLVLTLGRDVTERARK